MHVTFVRLEELNILILMSTQQMNNWGTVTVYVIYRKIRIAKGESYSGIG